MAYNILLLMVLAALLVNVSRSVSAQEWVKAGSKIYYVSAERMTWKEAATFCVLPEFNNRFRFAEVKTEAQNKKLGKALLAAINTDETGAWFSASRVKKKTWKWGNLQDVAFTAWAKGQPGSTDRCAFAWVKSPTGTPKWGAAPCNELRHAVCEAYSFSKVYSIFKQNKDLNKFEAESLCLKKGGTLGIIGNPGDNKVLIDFTTSNDDPATLRPTRKPTKRPTFGPRPCCKVGDEVGACCSTTTSPNDNSCSRCRCCCCTGTARDIRACCAKSNYQQCGCGNVTPSTKSPTRIATKAPTRMATKSPTRLIIIIKSPTFPPTFRLNRRRMDDDDPIMEKTRRLQVNNAQRVFLGAMNEKLPRVKEENASFVWANGLSFKPIGYFPKALSQIYTNWATFPVQNAEKACVTLDVTDGKWYNEPCTAAYRGAICEFRITQKQFLAVPNEPRNWTASGYLCAQFGMQHATIKTTAELNAALKEMKKKEVAVAWTSGHQYGNDRSRLYWADGMLLTRHGTTIGPEAEVLDPGTQGADCVALYSNGTLARFPCNEEVDSLCESRPPNAPIVPFKPTKQNKCFPGCLASMRGDGELEAVCNHYTCGFDNDDGGECAPGCSFKKLSNGKCDAECFKPACAFDTRDCFGKKPKQGESGRRQLQIENEVEPETQVGVLPSTCSQTSQECDPSWIGDKFCDIIACGRECDAQDCQQVEVVETCGATCSPSDLYNNRCDKGCATLGCNFDGGLCPLSCDAACGPKIALNQCTTPECDVPMCRYDVGRCRPDNTDLALRCNPACDTRVLGNGQCNPGCNNPECKWDAGDCPQRDYCPYPVPFDEYGCIDQCNKPLFKFQRGMCPNECLRNGCTLSLLGNGVCNTACNNPKCGMDGGDCAPCAAGCNPFELNNGVCDERCNVPACGFDGGDCL